MDTAEQLGIDLAEIPDRSELKQIVSPGESIILAAYSSFYKFLVYLIITELLVTYCLGMIGASCLI